MSTSTAWYIHGTAMKTVGTTSTTAEIAIDAMADAPLRQSQVMVELMADDAARKVTGDPPLAR
ncbi:MAG: hypothetical protein EON53_09605, partial [Actinomycetales bacterium]